MATEIIRGKEKTYLRITYKAVPLLTEGPVSFSRRLDQVLTRLSTGENRFQWVGISMVIQAIFITPLVGLVILKTGNLPVFWAMATAVMYLTFIPSLAGLSSKKVVTVFLFSVLINLLLILSASLVDLLS
ncbi:MAG: hypothetical protein GC171_15070 [Terrimonas sp.]|nr:hypothetical protein [Terrimonas sp.]